jgi:predicted outer membrane repeat protein
MGDTSKGPILRGPFGELRPLAAALTLGFGLSLSPTTYAANFTVSNLNDSGAGSLRDAITQANAAPGADTITFTVTGTIPLLTEIDIADDVTITGPGAASLTISPTGFDRVFYIDDNNPTVTISGVTIQRTTGTSTDNGGAIFNYAGTLTIQNSVISGNATTGRGGAIFNYGGTVNIVNTSMTGNDSVTRGGAIYNYHGDLNVTNSTLSGNTANSGGAIYLYRGNVSIVSSTLSGNQTHAGTGSGGALYARNGYLSVQNSTFSGNTAAYDGGGISSAYALVTISNSTFTGNAATTGVGGAVALYNTTLTLVSTILANSTESGGGTGDIGAFTLYYYNGDLTTGVKKPGHHHMNAAHHKATITNVHRAGKTKAAQGLKAPKVHAKAHIAKPHVSAKARTSGRPHTSSSTVNATNSLIENDGGFINGTNLNNILGQDPALGPLANNGGPTRTHALLAGSPAIDKGSNPNALAFDQRGTPFVRTSGTQTDIGAFEVQGAAPPPPGTPLDIPTLSQWGTVMLSGLLGVWAAITGFGRRRRSGGS